MDVEGLGDKLVDQLVETGAVKSYGDLYRLDLDRLADLERMGKKSSENLLASIEASKSRGLARLLNALSIRHVGTRVAAVLAEHFQTMDALQKADVESLSEIMEIGPVIAASVQAFLSSAPGRRTIDDLTGVGVRMSAPRAERQPRHGRRGQDVRRHRHAGKVRPGRDQGVDHQARRSRRRQRVEEHRLRRGRRIARQQARQGARAGNSSS